ncbi:MAG: acyl-CoA dehydratase activase-related protein [Candidatus Geothermincolia bacterium]
MVVGIPSGLLFYRYFPLWRSFLEELGAEVVESGETTKSILAHGVTKAENDSCLPVKVFYGHALALKDKVDALFIPRLVSVERRTHTCPKMLGLPDMIRMAEDEMPPIISPTIDVQQGFLHNYRAIYELGSLFTSRPSRILRAGAASWRHHRDYQEHLARGLKPRDAMSGNGASLSQGRHLRVAVMGHHYNVFDSFTTMSLLDRLHGMDVDVVTADMIPEEIRQEELETLPRDIYWSYERDVVGAILACVRRQFVDGVIFMISFACGPDSIVQVVVEQERRAAGDLPMMSMVIDEHTGEGGFVTRIEAFIDLLRRKKRQELAGARS